MINRGSVIRRSAVLLIVLGSIKNSDFLLCAPACSTKQQFGLIVCQQMQVCDSGLCTDYVDKERGKGFNEVTFFRRCKGGGEGSFRIWAAFSIFSFFCLLEEK